MLCQARNAIGSDIGNWVALESNILVVMYTNQHNVCQTLSGQKRTTLMFSPYLDDI